MNKKIIFSCISLIVLIGLGVFVSGFLVQISNSGEYRAELFLQKGWNLVPSIDIDLIEQDSNIKSEDILATYIFIPEKNKYLLFDVDDTNSEFFKYFSSANEERKNYIKQSPVWIYTERAGNIKYPRGSFPALNEFELNNGWNFITFTPEVVSIMFNQKSIVGDCDVQKSYFFNPDNQNWVVWPMGDLIEEIDSADDEDYLGLGWLVKVSNKCKLGSNEGSISPPTIPN